MPIKPSRGVLAVLFTLALAACSPSGSSNAFQPKQVEFAAAATRPLAVGGRWVVHFADEATTGPGGTDLSGDGDTDDEVVVATIINSGKSFVTGVIAREVIIANGEVYMIALESEEAFDWSTDGDQNDVVLLHYDRDFDVRFVDTIRTDLSGPSAFATTRRLYYSSTENPTAPDSTSLRYLRRGEPTVPVPIDGFLDGETLRGDVFYERDDLVFIRGNELFDGVDWNDDGDTTDASVLFLLNGNEETSIIENVGLALDSAMPVANSRRIQSNEWDVGFLVSEAAQGDTVLNSPADFGPEWEPAQCVATPDSDSSDSVLFFLNTRDWQNGVQGPVNTGLAGSDRVVVVDDAVATLAMEADAGCDLNVDGDMDDTITRWASTETFGVVNVLPENMLAVFPLPGGALGLGGLDDRFIVSVDEIADGRDHDDDGELSRILLAWVNPDFDPTFRFLFQDSEGPFTFVEADWLVDDDEERLLLATSFRESLVDVSLNTNCLTNPNEDDATDTLAAWTRVADNQRTFIPGAGFAVPPGNPGTVFVRSSAMFRVSEALDDFDHNRDGDKEDIILMRVPIFDCDPDYVGTAADTEGPIVEYQLDASGGAFLGDESMEGIDWNEDGDTDDLVVRFFEV